MDYLMIEGETVITVMILDTVTVTRCREFYELSKLSKLMQITLYWHFFQIYIHLFLPFA